MSPFRHSPRPAYDAGAPEAPMPSGPQSPAPRTGAAVLVPAYGNGAS
ncbi:hypothetical protein ACFVYP_38815 [Kitasatospora sp. NPDC058201]